MDSEELIQTTAGTLVTFLLLWPLIICVLTGTIGYALATFFTGFNYGLTIAYIAIIGIALLTAWIVYEEHLQQALFGGFIAILEVSLILLLFGGAGAAITFALSEWGALILILISVAVALIATLINWWGWLSYFKIGG